MDLKGVRLDMNRGGLIKRLLLRGSLFALCMMLVSVMHMVHEAQYSESLMLNFDECTINFGTKTSMNFSGLTKPMSDLSFSLFGHLNVVPCEESKNLSKNVFKELINNGLLVSNAKSLCVGEGAASAGEALRDLGFADTLAVDRHPFFSLLKRRFVYELGYDSNSFDFVFSRALDKVSVPALLVFEIERVLRPGGVGAMLVGSHSFYTGNLVRSATPISSFLRSSEVVHLCRFGTYTLVIFRKRFGNVGSFDQFLLPEKCPSIANNKPFMKYIEPLIEHGHLGNEPSYLANHMNISSRDRLMYINVGAGDFSNLSIPKLVKLYDPIKPHAFNFFMVDHNTSVISSHVNNPGITFIYHPQLAGTDYSSDLNPDEYVDAPLDEGEFDFVRWFSETIEEGDFVVLRMNARAVELTILSELFKTGAICHVDELFLRCADPVDCKGDSCGDCMRIFRSLRNNGLFVHQWMED
ncbi:hypothetical protein LIER_29244 [Lithospermum erythrorhizon]|uniref:Methyltransferase type 11 domain-containing protein n=1 Tax=Lithospermum erythrorhizon TaxID=34254 RepID=A0AAV3RNM0_LITER